MELSQLVPADNDLYELLDSVVCAMESGIVKVSVSSELLSQCLTELEDQSEVIHNLISGGEELRFLVLMMDGLLYQKSVGTVDEKLFEDTWNKILKAVGL